MRDPRDTFDERYQAGLDEIRRRYQYDRGPLLTLRIWLAERRLWHQIHVELPNTSVW